MLIVGGIGLAVNIAAAFVLHAGSKHSLNVDGAFKHVMADLMGSVGVVISGVIVILTGWVLIDPILSIGIALLIVISSWKTGIEISQRAAGRSPGTIDLYACAQRLKTCRESLVIHDVHVFTVTSNFDLLTAHILVEPSFRGYEDEIQRQLRLIASEKYNIQHVTFQLCHSAEECTEDHHVGHLEALSRSPG